MNVKGGRARGDGYQGYTDLMEGSDLTALLSAISPGVVEKT